MNPQKTPLGVIRESQSILGIKKAPDFSGAFFIRSIFKTSQNLDTTGFIKTLTINLLGFQSSLLLFSRSQLILDR